MTHDELVKIGSKWLRNRAVIPSQYPASGMRTTRCGIVLEGISSGYEIPDIVGWCYGGNESILIECKVSLSDFRADAKKEFRADPSQGVGTYRYYLTPPRLITVDKLPERWGLLETTGKRTKVIKLAGAWQERNFFAELGMLWSALRRQDIRPIVISARDGVLFDGEKPRKSLLTPVD